MRDYRFTWPLPAVIIVFLFVVTMVITCVGVSAVAEPIVGRVCRSVVDLVLVSAFVSCWSPVAAKAGSGDHHPHPRLVPTV